MMDNNDVDTSTPHISRPDKNKNAVSPESKGMRRASYLVALLQYLMMRLRMQQAARTFP